MRIKIGKIKIFAFDILFYLIALLGFLTLVFTIFYNELILRVLSYAFFAVGYVLYYSSLRSNGISKSSLPSVIFIFYILLLWIINGFEYNVLVVCLSFFLMFSSFESAKTIKPKPTLISMIYGFYFAQAFLLIFASFTKYAYMSFSTGYYVSPDLMLGLSNPNETGMALVYTIIGLLLCMLKKKNRSLRFITVLIILYLIYLLFLTRARTSFLGLIIFIILSLVYRNKKGLLFKNKFIYLLFIIFPIVFVPFYLYFSMNYANRIALFGKTLFSGRELVYYDHLILWSNKILGNISVFHLDNAHNGFFTILINFGVVGIIFYLIHLISNLNEIKENNCTCDISRVGFIALLCVFFMSSSEAAFIVAGKFYYANFLILTWFANYSDNEEVYAL